MVNETQAQDYAPQTLQVQSLSDIIFAENEYRYEFMESEARAIDATNPPFVALKLSDGRIATVFRGRGKHIQKAQTMARGDETQYVPALMHLLVRVNGAQLPAEDFADLWATDYTAILIEVQSPKAGNF